MTGTAQSGGLKKLDASFQITTASLEEIHDVGPSSAADLLKIVPSVWVESGGGAAGPNIELAGYPGGSGAPYVTYSINGSPMYPSHNLSFMDDSSMFRLDDTVERAEVVLGGPGVVFSDGQMGATANFILRQGTATPHGDLGVTVGSEGMYRVDGFYGGPIAQDWYMSIGGFYRKSDGIRNSQFPADDGGQLTATLSHDMDNGTIMFYARELNDKNLFISDIPLMATGTGKNVTYSAFPGFNPLTGWYRRQRHSGPVGAGMPGLRAAHGQSGRRPRREHAHLRQQSRSAHRRRGSPEQQAAVHGRRHADHRHIQRRRPPVTMSGFIAERGHGGERQRGRGGRGRLGHRRHRHLRRRRRGRQSEHLCDGRTDSGWWTSRSSRSPTICASPSSWCPATISTVGGYFAAYSSDDTWYLGNNELMTATPNALADQPDPEQRRDHFQQRPDQRLHLLPGGPVQGHQLRAVRFRSWRIGQWLLDAGSRVEQQKVNGTIENDIVGESRAPIR